MTIVPFTIETLSSTEYGMPLIVISTDIVRLKVPSLSLVGEVLAEMD